MFVKIPKIHTCKLIAYALIIGAHLDKCLLNFHVQLILFCLFLQAVELSTDEAMLKSIYKPASDEKMSDVKVRHLMYRIVSLICFFDHRLNVITKGYVAEMINQGCLVPSLKR